MTQTTTPLVFVDRIVTPSWPTPPKLKFDPDNDFQNLLRRRVEAHFAGRPQRDAPGMYLKTAVILGLFFASYVLLVFFAENLWQAIPLALLLGFSIAGIGFNIQHDAGHGAFSKHAWINRLLARTLDMVGGSSYLWHWKHAVFHHTYVNVDGHDTDIDLGGAVRLASTQERRWFHRAQHVYAWLLYCTAAIRWHLYTDFVELFRGRIGEHVFPRPRGWDLFVLIAGKLLFFTIAFVVPMTIHSPWVVLAFYVLAAAPLGFVLSVVFQLAHVVEEAEFPQPIAGTARMDRSFAVHQLETTVNFSRGNPVVTWLIGGLNYQIEHHLFPRISHVHYAELSAVVEATCREANVGYARHASFFDGVRSHARWLRFMGAAR